MTHTVRSARLLVLAVVAVVVWTLVAPGPARARGSGPDVIAVNVRGTGAQEPSAPDRFLRQFDVYSLAGDKVGTVSQDFAFTGPTTGDHIMTFHFADGDLVNHGVLSFAPDSTRPGFIHTGLHPEGDTIVAGQGTGAYAGRTGRLRMAGWHDVREFPARATLDDFYVITLDPPR